MLQRFKKICVAFDLLEIRGICQKVLFEFDAELKKCF